MFVTSSRKLAKRYFEAFNKYIKEIIPFLKSQQYEKVYTFFSKNEMLLDYKPRLEVRLNNMSIYRPKEYKGVFK